MKARSVIGWLLGAVVAFVAIFIGDLLLDHWLVVGKGPAGGKIRSAARAEGAKSIDIAALMPFEWSELTLHGPYQSRKRICDAEKLAWLDCRKVPEMIEEGEFLLLFKTAQGLAYMERHDREDGDFSDAQEPVPVVPAKAVFRVIQERAASVDDYSWPRLQWQP